MKVHVVGPTRRKPKCGDRRFTHTHGEQVRVFEIASCGAYVMSGGRHRYEWISLEKAAVDPRWCHLLTDAERLKHGQPLIDPEAEA
jgi:hypothetical protein